MAHHCSHRTKTRLIACALESIDVISRSPSAHFRRMVPLPQSPTLGIPANLLHDLNSQLGIIVTHSDLIRLRAGSDPDINRHVRAIVDAANEIGDALTKIVNR